MRCKDLSPTAKLIFGRLCQYAGRNGEAYPEYNTLGEEVGIKRRQAIRAVNELEAYGLIRRIHRRRADGGETSNLYIFTWNEIYDQHSAPHVTIDTGGSVMVDTVGECPQRHPRMPSATPQKNNVQESMQLNKRTKYDFSLLLSLADKTPFAYLTEAQWSVLIKRHGQEYLQQVLDIASESWRRTPKEIPNPGGYLEVLCKSLSVPVWYTPREERERNKEKAEQSRLSTSRAQEAAAVERERLAQRKKQHWESLNSTDQDRYCKIANAKMPYGGGTLLARIVILVAMEEAWDDTQNIQESHLPNTPGSAG